MKFTFPAENLCTSQEQTLTALYPEGYENRRTVLCDHGFLFDGRGTAFRGDIPEVLGRECFTISLSFLPLTFSAHTDGLISCYDEPSRCGLELLLGKGGVVTARFGNGRFHTELSSCNAHVRPGVKNIVTLVYQGRPGWCDLYVNGVFSNRRQFSARTCLTLPRRPWYLGRRADGWRFAEDSPFGCFYGFLKWVSFDGHAADTDEVLALHKEHFTGNYETEAVALGMPHRSAYRADRHRPKFHLCPPGRWMNEPHGPMYYDGWYHIFYQGNPHAPVWDHISWGHLYSRDMVRWQDAPLALTPENCAVAPDGIWSGSSVIDKDGKPRIYYTAGNDHDFPNQAVALATPAAGTDGRLLQWDSYPKIIQKQDIGWLGEFRDPFVWLENDTYFMLVGTGDEHYGAGNAALYSSDDGINWTNHGMLMDYDFSINSIVGHVWELPVLLPLKDEAGQVVCHILLLCACRVENDLVETPYFLGRWDPDKRTFTRLHDRARLLDLGKGYFTGPSGFVTPDGRTVCFTIAQGRQGFRGDLCSGWAHNGGIPAELFFKDGDAGIRPIRELETLRKNLLLDCAGDCNDLLRRHPGDMLCLELTARGDSSWVSLCAGEERLTVRYDRLSRRLRVLDSQGQEIGRYRGAVDDVDIGAEPIHFTCYLDHSMFEVYLNNKKSVTLRNYFPEARFLQTGGEIEGLRLWEMDTAYPED